MDPAGQVAAIRICDSLWDRRKVRLAGGSAKKVFMYPSRFLAEYCKQRRVL